MILQRIPDSEIVVEPSSLMDHAGRVFWWKGNVYRAIDTDHAQFYRDLLEQKDRDALFSHGLVETASSVSIS